MLLFGILFPVLHPWAKQSVLMKNSKECWSVKCIDVPVFTWITLPIMQISSTVSIFTPVETTSRHIVLTAAERMSQLMSVKRKTERCFTLVSSWCGSNICIETSAASRLVFDHSNCCFSAIVPLQVQTIPFCVWYWAGGAGVLAHKYIQNVTIPPHRKEHEQTCRTPVT